MLGGSLATGCADGGEDGKAASREDCTNVQMHNASLRMASVRANSKLNEEELNKHQKNFARVSESYLEQCVEDRSKGWVRCMLNLEKLGEATSCD